jgi:altronate hydrolase
MEPIAIRIHKNDNVVTAKSDIDINTNIEKEKLNTNQHIPVGHKVATKDISKGNEMMRYYLKAKELLLWVTIGLMEK